MSVARLREIDQESAAIWPYQNIAEMQIAVNLAQRAIDVAIQQVVMGENRVRQTFGFTNAGNRIGLQVEIRFERLCCCDQRCRPRFPDPPANPLDHFAAIVGIFSADSAREC